MANNTKQPEPKWKGIDTSLEVLGFLALLALIFLPIIYYHQLPQTIPTHFDIYGKPDDFSSKQSLIALPVIGSFLYILLTAISIFIGKYNYPVKITPENAERQLRLAMRLVRIVKSLLVTVFCYIAFQTIQVARGNASGLGGYFVLISAGTFAVVLIFYFLFAYKKT
ncbi:MAG: DUF1648 domain-containing protein [Lentimicrobiaceae bacterium]|nr:DUF1648 domain-containing protein [Lentimicrobiaceae bacterium]